MKMQGLNYGGAKQIHIGGGVLCAILLAMSWLLGLGPMLTETHQATSVVEDADGAEALAKQDKAKLDQLTIDLQQIRVSLEQDPITLESASQINPLLNELAEWAKANDLSITRTRAEQRVEMAYYDYLPITLSGEGGYNDLLNFFKKLHSDRGDLGVLSFNAKRLSNGSTLGFEIQLSWYVLSDSPLAPGGPSTAAVSTD